MEYSNLLKPKCREEFREWLIEHSASERECWVPLKRGKPTAEEILYYLDAVEEALCFGWIDSTIRTVDGVAMQRFSPRRKNSQWTELNKERVRRLEKLGLMTDAGRAVLPDMDIKNFKIDEEISNALKQARVWSKFKSFHPLYQRIRAYNIAFTKIKYPQAYQKSLANLIEQTRKGKMYGEWNDYGRLLEVCEQ